MDKHKAEAVPANVEQQLLSGQFVLHTLIAEFTAQVDKKVDQLLNQQQKTGSNLTKDNLAKSLQRGEDPQFDQLLCSLGCVAEYCLPSLLDTLFGWYDYQLPDKKNPVENVLEDKQHKQGSKGKSDSKHMNENARDQWREFAVEFVFCLVLIEVLQQIPVHPLPDSQIRRILSKAFSSFHASAHPKAADVEIRIIADLYAEAIGVLAQTKFQAVRHKFMYELLKDKEASVNTLIALIMGMKYFRVKMYPIEDFEASFRFLQELATYSLDIKHREVKHALAGLFVEVLIPVAAAVKTEVNVPVLRDFVDSLYPTSLELSKRAKNKQAMYPLITCLLCVSQKTFFLNNWHIFLDICLSTLKHRDQKLSRVALESLYRLLWVYMVRIKCESNTTTQARLQSIVKNLFPAGSRNVFPKDTPLNIFVKIIQFIALERLDFAMKEIILDLLSVSTSSSRSTKMTTLYPERMNVGLRAFLVITDSLQQKEGAPPMPSTINVMPSGNTIRVKKTFLNKTLTEDDARAIGVLHHLRHVQRALDGIILSLDSQVGARLLQTNSQFFSKDPQDILSSEQKPKIELFRTCVAALPRLMPHGMPRTDLLDMLCRLTIHIDDDLRSRAIASLQAFVIDFPVWSEEVVASFLSFVLKYVSDIHQALLDASLKILTSLICAWKSNITGADNSKTPTKQVAISKNKDSGAQSPSSPLSHSSSSCAYASIINRIEGYALVVLCSSRNITRKLACHILKEIRVLARALNYGHQEDPLCLDILDNLCPEVSDEVLKDVVFFKNLKQQEREAILSAGYEKEFSSLVDLSANWTESGGLHPWIHFMNLFVQPSRLPKFCHKALTYSWPDAYVRSVQIQKYIEPFMTTGSKKVTSTPLLAEDILTLWTHYLIFSCCSSPASVSIKLRQSNESAIPAGTPDWKVSMIRDGERLDAVPSTLFQKLVSIIRSDNFLAAFKESAVLGLGYTSTAAFHDLLTELNHLIHEASETKRQENVRRRRRRENIRIFLIKLFANLAIHKILSKGIYKQVEKLSGSQKIPKEVVQEYVEQTRSVLEALDKSELVTVTSFSSQPQITTAAFSNPTISNLNSASLKEEMRLNFTDMVIHLIRYYPITSRPNLLLPETKKRLFQLFNSWYDKHLKDSDRSSLSVASDNYPTKMLLAQCSVLCCGPVFDELGFGNDGYLFNWLESILNCSRPYTRQLGREAVILLLHFNPNLSTFLDWLLEKCYTATNFVSSICFLSMASVFSHASFPGDILSILTVTLFKTTDPDPEVSQEAEHLLAILLRKYFDYCPIEQLSPNHDCESNSVMRKGSIIKSISDATTRRSYLKATEDLSRVRPEITHAVLSEIFFRFPKATAVRQQKLLEIMQPWFKNVELILVDSLDNSPSHREVTCNHNHPWLPNTGWGSEEASLHVLNNLMYLTLHYHESLEAEIQSCWAVLCSTWQGNLNVCMQYLTSLYSVKSTDLLRTAVRLAVTYISRANGARVSSFLIDDCLLSKPVNITAESTANTPFYKIVSHNAKLDSSRDSPMKNASSPNGRNLSFSESDAGSVSEKKSVDSGSLSRERCNNIKDGNSRSSSPAVVERRSFKSNAPTSHRYSLQVTIGGDKRTLSEQTGKNLQTSPSLAKRSPKLSSSMMSLNKSASDGSMSPGKVSSPRFNTVSPTRSNDQAPKHTGLEILTSKLPQKFTSSKGPILKVSPKKSETKHSGGKSNDLKNGGVCKDRNFLMMKFGEWLSTYHGGEYPKPLPFFSFFIYLPLHEQINCEKVEGLLYSSVSCIFLSELVLSRSIDINWHAHLPTIMLSLILNMDQTEIMEVPFYCRRMLAHVYLTLAREKIPPYLIGSILSYSLDSCVNTLTPSSVSVSIQPKFQSEKKIYPEQFLTGLAHFNFKVMDYGLRTLTGEQLKEAFECLLNTLTSDTNKLWSFEDVTPKATSLKSVDRLSAFVQVASQIIEYYNPRFRLRERLAGEAAKFSVSTINKHHACRSLQVFRSLELPLTPVFFNKLIRCLVGRIAYGSDAELQSHVIEILMTLLHDCDVDCLWNDSFRDESPKSEGNGRPLLDNDHSSHPSINRTQSDMANRKPRSPTPGRVPNFPGSPTRTGPVPLSLPVSHGTNSGGQCEAPKRGRKVHAHRRSGSVTLSKKIATELLNTAAAQGGFHASSKSVPELRIGAGAGNPHNNMSYGDGSGRFQKPKNMLSPEHNIQTSSSISRTSSVTIELDIHPSSSEGDDVFSPVHTKSRGCGKERKSTFAQMFWIGVALLESDYEHEFLMAVQLLEKVLMHLPLDNPESRSHIERYLPQIKWSSFSGVQSLLLKGLTSLTTYNSTFRLLSSFTAISNLQLITGDLGEHRGLAMNVVSLLPNLMDSFVDPDTVCSNAARRIAEVCTEKYSDEKKLQSLAHVMMLYCNHSYVKPSTIWISVVAKYIHESFPEGIREQLDFLLEMLDRGPGSSHLSCLRIVYSLLSLSELLLTNSQPEMNFMQSILRTVSKFVNNTKLWKDALNILKLAVSRSSAITTPAFCGPPPSVNAFIGDIERIELPGRTLTFQYNLSDTPIVGRRRLDDQPSKKHAFSGSPSYHPSTASSGVSSSWRKPVFSQKRTYESISCVAPICGKHLQITSEPPQPDEVLTPTESPERFILPAQHDNHTEEEEKVEGKSDDNESKEEEEEEEDEEAGSVVDDIVVLRNFDFLDEFEENDDGFTTGYQNQTSAQVVPESDLTNGTEDDPDTCNLTPMSSRETGHDVEVPAVEEEFISDHSDAEEQEKQEMTSQTSGVLSQSWSGTKSLFTEMESHDIHSSLITISSLEAPEEPSNDGDVIKRSSDERITGPDLLRPSNLVNRLTQSETALDQKGMYETSKISELENTNELDENNTSDSISNLDESDNEFTCSSPISSLEELRITKDQMSNDKDSVTTEDHEKTHENLLSSLKKLTTPPPPTSRPMQSSPKPDVSRAEDIPIVEPPPITNDITSNLSAVRFDSPSHFLSIADSPSKTAHNVPAPPAFSAPECSPVAYQDTTYTAWKLHIVSATTYSNTVFVVKTFELFPQVFKVLCIDFSDFGKEGCKHLGGQLSKIAEHFSSMVEQLPSQIKCPHCLVTKSAIEPVAESLMCGIQELQENLDSYNARLYSAGECIEAIENFGSSGIKKESVAQFGGASKSQGIGRKQLELCRNLYKLHYQLLLLLKSFNKLIRFVTAETGNKNITEQLSFLKKKILVIEKSYQAHRDKQDSEMLHDLKSRTIEEAEQVLTSSISNEHVHLAIRQLFLLRKLWPPEVFGCADDPAANVLIKIYFKHLEGKSKEKFFAIMGSEESSHDMCERLMEVNGQIQQSLDSLALNAGDINKTPPVTKKTHF